MTLDRTTFLLAALAVTGACLVLDAGISRLWTGRARSERTHYVLSLISALIYIVAFQHGPATFRTTWGIVMLGLYTYDMAIIVREWRSLKKSYRVFYTTHHLASFCIFAVWAATFEVFTPAMAIGTVIWMTSDVWRWADQISRLSGRRTPPWVDRLVFRLERGHRIIAYIAALVAIRGRFEHVEEIILFSSAMLMDVIDTAFQLRAARRRKLSEQLVAALCREAPAFEGLDNADLDRIAEITIEKSAAEGATIFSQGDTGDGLYIVTRGSVGIFIGEDRVNTLGPGDLLGEMGLLSGQPRSATARALSPVGLAMVDRGTLLSLLQELPALEQALWRSFGARSLADLLRARPEWEGAEVQGPWALQAEVVGPKDVDEVLEGAGEVLLLLTGSVQQDGALVRAPALVPVGGDPLIAAADGSRGLLLAQAPSPPVRVDQAPA